MKTKQPKRPKARNHVANVTLMRKGGAHGKSTGAKRRKDKQHFNAKLRQGDFSKAA